MNKRAEKASNVVSSLKKTYSRVKGSKNESKVRAALTSAMKESINVKSKLIEAKKTYVKAQKVLKESRKNSDLRSQLAESKAAIESLRTQLSETNLYNAKLVYANKLLQNEQLTSEQKSQVIDKLDDAKSLREAKLVYTGLINDFTKKSLQENAAPRNLIAGGTSRTTKPASTSTVNESVESQRWAKLAGLVK